MVPISLTAEQFQRISRALADPNRYEMLRRIYSTEGQTCGGVTCELPIAAGTASHHLRELELAELIQVTKDGRYRKLAPRREVWRAYLAELQTVDDGLEKV